MMLLFLYSVFGSINSGCIVPILLPESLAPNVSKASGTKQCVLANCREFWRLGCFSLTRCRPRPAWRIGDKVTVQRCPAPSHPMQGSVHAPIVSRSGHPGVFHRIGSGRSALSWMGSELLVMPAIRCLWARCVLDGDPRSSSKPGLESPRASTWVPHTHTWNSHRLIFRASTLLLFSQRRPPVSNRATR